MVDEPIDWLCPCPRGFVFSQFERIQWRSLFALLVKLSSSHQAFRGGYSPRHRVLYARMPTSWIYLIWTEIEDTHHLRILPIGVKRQYALLSRTMGDCTLHKLDVVLLLACRLYMLINNTSSPIRSIYPGPRTSNQPMRNSVYSRLTSGTNWPYSATPPFVDHICAARNPIQSTDTPHWFENSFAKTKIGRTSLEPWPCRSSPWCCYSVLVLKIAFQRHRRELSCSELLPVAHSRPAQIPVQSCDVELLFHQSIGLH